MNSHFKIGILLILSLTSCVKPLADTGVIKWDLSSLDLPQMNYNGKTYYIHPDAGEMTYQEALSYCEKLNAYSYQDWFLPDKQELSEMFTQAASLGGFQNAAYWFENPYADKDSDRYLSYKNGNFFSGIGRVRPVRCESTFVPGLKIKQVIPQNWNTYEITTIPKSNRYDIKKVGISVILKSNPNFKRVYEASKTEDNGTFYASINDGFVEAGHDYRISAFAELSNGQTVFSDELLILYHPYSWDITINQTSSTSIHVVLNIKDWGFPRYFEYYKYLTFKVCGQEQTLKVNEYNLQYETDFDNLKLPGSSITVSVSGTINIEESFPLTTFFPSAVRTLNAYGGALHGEIADVGYPRYSSAGFVYSNSNNLPTINDNVLNQEYISNNKLEEYVYHISRPFYYRAYIKQIDNDYKEHVYYGDVVYVESY